MVMDSNFDSVLPHFEDTMTYRPKIAFSYLNDF